MTSAKFNARTARAPLRRGLSNWPRVILTITLAAIFTSAAAFAQGTGPVISKIEISGNQRVEDDAIRIHVSQQPGQPLDDAAVDADLKAIYKMGFFSDVGDHIVIKGATTPESQDRIRNVVRTSLGMWWQFFQGMDQEYGQV